MKDNQRIDGYRQLKKDFKRTMDYFKLPPDVRAVAWDSALKRISSASRCYRAIVNSFPPYY